MVIDLNCDLGERDDAEGMAQDLALLDIVTSANIACGGHAGSTQSMQEIVAAAMQRGVALGAHPAYPDRRNFGRAIVDMSLSALEASITEQLEALVSVINRSGGTLTHVKAHGALYHRAMCDMVTAEAVARSIERIDDTVLLIGQAGAPALSIWRSMGWRVASEAFADRRYLTASALRSRTEPDAVIDVPSEAAAQAARLARRTGVMTATGETVPIDADTICIHSDRLNAIELAKAVRAAIEGAGVAVRALDA